MPLSMDWEPLGEDYSIGVSSARLIAVARVWEPAITQASCSRGPSNGPLRSSSASIVIAWLRVPKVWSRMHTTQNGAAGLGLPPANRGPAERPPCLKALRRPMRLAILVTPLLLLASCQGEDRPGEIRRAGLLVRHSDGTIGSFWAGLV